MSDTQEQEISAIEQGFKQALIGAFTIFYNETGEHTKWADAAVIRFRAALTNARAVRAIALKAIAEERNE